MTESLRMDAEEDIYRKIISDAGDVWVNTSDLAIFGKLAEYRVMKNLANVCVTINGNVKGSIRSYTEL